MCTFNEMGVYLESERLHEILHYKNAAFYITHFHVLGVRPEHNFHLSLGNTKELGSLCYGGTC
jgi:hypothetical protein